MSISEIPELTTKTESGTINGRDVFEYYYRKMVLFIIDPAITSYYHKEDKMPFAFQNTKMLCEVENDSPFYFIKAQGLKSIITDLGIVGYEYTSDIYIFDHYFRYLYRIMKFVDESNFLEKDKKYIDERYKYMGILRATLSPYELVFLFYNGLSEKGSGSKKYIEKYTMLKNIRWDLLVSDNTLVSKEIKNYIEEYSKNDPDYLDNISFSENDVYYYNRSAIFKKHNSFLLNK